jgi:hypothetical protein
MWCAHRVVRRFEILRLVLSLLGGYGDNLDLRTPKRVDYLYHESRKENFSCAVTPTKWTTTPSGIDDVNITRPQENNNQPNAIDDGHSTCQCPSGHMETKNIWFVHQYCMQRKNSWMLFTLRRVLQADEKYDAAFSQITIKYSTNC